MEIYVGYFKQFMVDNSHRETDVKRVAEAISLDSHTILDVREQDEWDGAHIEESVHIPLGELEVRAGELPMDKPIYTVCHSGVRSLAAIDILDRAGYSGAKSLAGGVVAWYQTGKPLVP